MSQKCPVCLNEIPDYTDSCQKCGAKVQIKEIIDTEVVDNEQTISNAPNTPDYNSILQALDPSLRKVFTYRSTKDATRKLIIGATFLFYTSPVAILLCLMNLYFCFYLLLHTAELERLLALSADHKDIETEKKGIFKTLLFNIVFLALSIIIAYYIYFWIKK